MRVLVIGGTQFIGLAVVKRLVERGHEVAVFNRGKTPVELPDGVQHIRGDVKVLGESRSEFEAFRPDVVMHNLIFNEADAQSMLDVFTGIAKRAVMVSSMDVYQAFGRLHHFDEDTIDAQLPLDETAPLRRELFPYRQYTQGDEQHFMYSYDKIPAEQLVLASETLPTTVLRLPMVYGENDGQHRLYSFIKPMLDGRPAIVMDELQANWRSMYGYVENVAEAIVLACEDDRAVRQVYNVGDMTPSILQLGQMVAKAMDWQGGFVVLPADELPESLRADPVYRHQLVFSAAKIAHELGFQPRYSDQEGVNRAVEWEKVNPPPVNPQQEPEGDPLNYAAQDDVLRAQGYAL
jgi:nucleoside-diphosphate-sugar epimerase